MITLNLLPDVKREYLRTRRLQAKVMAIATLVSIVAVGLVVVLAISVYGGQAVYKNYITGEIQKNGDKLKAVPEIDKYLTLQNQLNYLTELHGNKTDFSRLLKFLPAMNPAAPNNVRLVKVDATSDETQDVLVLEGEVANYTALNTFRDTLTNAELKYDGQDTPVKLFETVEVISSSLESSQTGGKIVVFRIQTTYKKEAFLYSTKNAVVNVPQMVTTQSVQNAPNVFGGSTKKEE